MQHTCSLNCELLTTPLFLIDFKDDADCIRRMEVKNPSMIFLFPLYRTRLHRRREFQEKTLQGQEILSLRPKALAIPALGTDLCPSRRTIYNNNKVNGSSTEELHRLDVHLTHILDYSRMSPRNLPRQARVQSAAKRSHLSTMPRRSCSPRISIAATPTHDAHFNREARAKTHGSNIVSTWPQAAQRIQDDEHGGTGRIPVVPVDIERGADVRVGKMQCVLCAVQDCRAAGVQGPVQIWRLAGPAPCVVAELLEHGGNGADCGFGHVFADGCNHALWGGGWCRVSIVQSINQSKVVGGAHLHKKKKTRAETK